MDKCHRKYLVQTVLNNQLSVFFIRSWTQCHCHTGDFPRGVGHRVENGRGLTKVAVVLLNGLIW